ncbi:MAG: GNAT family N-acetyltransferase [Anaerolineae bacterium]
MHEAIRQLEYITLNAWPALETEQYDGWLLRYAKGYTGRANSVNPLGGSRLPLSEKIAYCERWYQARGLPPVFRLNLAMQPPELDAYLEARGYRRYNETLVQRADLHQLPAPIADRFSYQTSVSADWLADWGRWNAVPSASVAIAHEMLSGTQQMSCYGRIGDQAVGLAVCEGDFVGLFDLVVAPSQRRQGIGRDLVNSLLHWGKQQGARYAYLQVVADNQPARRLYQQLGFVDHHHYWYRKAPDA